MKEMIEPDEFTKKGAFLGLVSYLIFILIITMVFYLK
jgi:hypothetical protein